MTIVVPLTCVLSIVFALVAATAPSPHERESPSFQIIVPADQAIIFRHKFAAHALKVMSENPAYRGLYFAHVNTETERQPEGSDLDRKLALVWLPNEVQGGHPFDEDEGGEAGSVEMRAATADETATIMERIRTGQIELGLNAAEQDRLWECLTSTWSDHLSLLLHHPPRMRTVMRRDGELHFSYE